MTPAQINAAIAASPTLQALIYGDGYRVDSDGNETVPWPGDFGAVAAALTVMQAPTMRSLTVNEMFDVLFTSGDYAVLKAAQQSGDSRAVQAFAVLADARTLGPGTVNLTEPTTAALLDALQSDADGPALLTEAGRSALVAAATFRNVVDWRAVQAAFAGA